MRQKGRQRVASPWAVLVLALVMGIDGCAVGPNFKSPQARVQQSWTGLSPEAASQPSAATSQPAEVLRWWEVFHDPVLTDLVEQALQSNLNVQLAEARLRQSRAARGVIVGGLFPTVTASSAYQREHIAGASNQNLYQAGLDAAWELDVFGGIRRNVESANANIEAAQASLRDTQVSLMAEVALDYFQLRGFQQAIVIALDNLKAQKHTADITRQRLAAGFISALDVANAEAEVATTEAQIPVLQIGAQQSIYALSVLLARPPDDLLSELSPTGPLPQTPARIPVGLPSDLLRRRPDIRQAEALLHAATAQIGVATAELFPQFSLTGSMNWQSNSLQDWFNGSSRSWAFGPSMSWPFFQGGSLISNIRVQEALRDQAFLTYHQTVLTALQEVENSLIAFSKEQEHRKSLNDAVVANHKAEDISMQLYVEGETDFLNVLNAQRSLYASEDALVQSQLNVATDLVALYKALGGGWEDQTPQIPTSSWVHQAATAPAQPSSR